MIKRKSNYDKFPKIEISGQQNCAWQGWKNAGSELARAAAKVIACRNRCVIAVDCYPGVRKDELLKNLSSALSPALTVDVETALLGREQIETMIRRNVTDDRVFGVLSCHLLTEFYDLEKLEALKEKIAKTSGTVLVFGFGASLASEPDILVYADLARWEIQQRYRSGEIANFNCENFAEDPLRKYKRGFFVDWRVADRHKRTLFQRIDYLLDTNVKNDPKLLSGEAFRAGLSQAANRPFRVVPFFDPGVWGGQWMKEVCGLPNDKPNYAWCFDCVPEENSLLLTACGVTAEIPSIDLVFTHPVELLGDKVHARFGAEFPIRFDFLDTMGGQNLSLQVHPLTEYIQNTFGMHYTQDESYYILDCKEGAGVYLGFKTGADPKALVRDLKQAQETSKFDAEKYVNKFPAKKHDHFLIPAGTLHCSGSDTMVLEISATPFIFTFKLWDWDRLGLDGRPRPVHIAHGAPNIQFDRDAEWTAKHLVGRTEQVCSGDGWREERTGLHEREFIETRRVWFTKLYRGNTEGGVHVCNLVEGECATVHSPEGKFADFEVHYAETFILPASLGEYEFIPHGSEKETGIVSAYVRT